MVMPMGPIFSQDCTSNKIASASACYCIPQCVRVIAGDWCLHVVEKSRIYSAVDKSKIKDKRKVKPKDKSWVKIGWRKKDWCVQKR